MSLFDKINKKLGVVKSKKEDNITVNLMKKPPKEKVVPRVINFEKNARHQADILFLPDDEGYKYALVVIDNASKIGDARPMRGKTANEVLTNLKSIYKGKYLKKPRVSLQTDPGGEFKGVVDKWLSDNGIYHKVGKVNRHRQQALVEHLNYVLGRALGTRQNAQELETGESSTEWVEDLPVIIEAFNEHSESKPKPNPDDLPTVKCRGMSCKLLKHGEKVRVIADRPFAAHDDSKLHGNFRASDLRWEKEIHTIEKIQLSQGQPPLYKVSGIDNVRYTREQLQLVSDNEVKTSQGAQKKWIVEKILKKKINTGKSSMK